MELTQTTSTAIKRESFKTICQDGVVLKGLLFIPLDTNSIKGVIQFNSGTATKKTFYISFVEFLAENGYIVCLWDCRGNGESAPKNLKNCEYRYTDYGIKDMPTIKNFLTQKFPNYPFFIFGHSAGGQQIGLMDNLENVKGMVNFAVSAGYLLNMPFGYLMTSIFFFFIFTPLSNLFYGFLSAKKFGFMEDMPKNAINEWKDWCLKEDYLFDDKFYGKTVPIGNYQKIDFPIHNFWTTDDTISNKKNTYNLWKHFKSSKPITFKELKPSEYNLKEIGHFGFFKKKNKDKFWQQALDVLDNFLEGKEVKGNNLENL